MPCNQRGIRVAIPLLVPLILLSNTYADLGQINLKITATLVANSCTVSTNAKDKTVDMGQWAAKQFASSPQGITPVPFTINLENCGSAAKGVKVTFTGSANDADTTLLALSGANAAKNIGIAILDKNRVRIPLGQPSPLYSLTAKTNSAVLNFYGQYVATATPVKPGSANADATFSLDYQ